MVALDWILWFIFLAIGFAAIFLEIARERIPNIERETGFNIPDWIKAKAALIGAISMTIAMYCVMNAMTGGASTKTELLTLKSELRNGQYQLISAFDGGQNRCLFWLSPVDEPAQVLPYMVSASLVSLQMYDPNAKTPIPAGLVLLRGGKVTVYLASEAEAEVFPKTVNNLLASQGQESQGETSASQLKSLNQKQEKPASTPPSKSDKPAEDPKKGGK
jgi:hypothetical protein